jgi:hypothetical protein
VSADQAVLRWAAAEECKDLVLRFMASFDARAGAQMEDCVTPDIEWQRPDQTIRGLPRLREVLAATPADVRVRHVITNLRAEFHEAGIVLHSYFTVYRHVGAWEAPEGPAPLTGPVSVGRYRDELVLLHGAWKLARKQTFPDFRRA